MTCRTNLIGARTWIKEYPLPPVGLRCHEDCPGWNETSDGFIQRCAFCARFPDDEQAAYFLAVVHNRKLIYGVDPQIHPDAEYCGGHLPDPTEFPDDNNT